MKARSRFPDERATCRHWRCRSLTGPIFSARSNSVYPITVTSGERSSWETLARKLSLRRSACCSRSFASRRTRVRSSTASSIIAACSRMRSRIIDRSSASEACSAKELSTPRSGSLPSLGAARRIPSAWSPAPRSGAATTWESLRISTSRSRAASDARLPQMARKSWCERTSTTGSGDLSSVSSSGDFAGSIGTSSLILRMPISFIASSITARLCDMCASVTPSGPASSSALSKPSLRSSSAMACSTSRRSVSRRRRAAAAASVPRFCRARARSATARCRPRSWASCSDASCPTPRSARSSERRGSRSSTSRSMPAASLSTLSDTSAHQSSEGARPPRSSACATWGGHRARWTLRSTAAESARAPEETNS